MDKKKLITFSERLCYRSDYFTYDPYDIWKTKIGLFLKSKYYVYPIIIAPIAGLLTLFDLFINNNYRIFYERQEYPIVRAIAAMSLINLYKLTSEKKYLKKAALNVEWLIENANHSYTGYGWGIGFKWPAGKNLLYKSDVPFSTHTPYALEAIFNLSKLNGKSYQEVFINVFKFYDNDLKILFEDNESMAISYGPMNDRIAVNATSYALFVYALFGQIFSEKEEYLKIKIKKFYNFIRNHQGADGEWLYMAFDKNSFIDCFHTCFIIQNLIKSQEYFPDIIEQEVIDKGWSYVKSNFFDSKFRLYRRFTKTNKAGLIKFDLYDNAEVLNTAIMLKDNLVVETLTESIFTHFYHKNTIYSAITITGSKVNPDCLRWAAMPFSYSISNYLLNYVRNTRVNKL